MGIQIAQSDFHDALVRGLAHRMNNILSLFHGYLGLLFDNETLDPATRAGLLNIREGAEAAADLMDRAKALARPSSAVWREVALPELLRRQMPALEECLRSGSRLELDCPASLPAVSSDASRIRTMVFELVKNAAEACPSRGGVVGIAVRLIDAEGPALAGPALIPHVEIAVTDNGPGIAAEAGDRIFQPFYTTKSKRNAAGLGLTVALGLAHQLGATLNFDRQAGQTTFRLLLPLTNAQIVP